MLKARSDKSKPEGALQEKGQSRQNFPFGHYWHQEKALPLDRHVLHPDVQRVESPQ